MQFIFLYCANDVGNVISTEPMKKRNLGDEMNHGMKGVDQGFLLTETKTPKDLASNPRRYRAIGSQG